MSSLLNFKPESLKFISASATALVFASLFTSSSALAQVTVTATNGTTYRTNSLSSATTNGAQMVGMQVIANFVGGGSQSLSWSALTSNTGGVTGTGWSLTNTGSTTFCDGSWTLSNTGAPGITSIVLNGAPGNTIFDRTFGGNSGTPGSDSGKDFAVTSGLGSYAITAQYTNQVQIGNAAPVGDIFATLIINFTGLTFTQGSTLAFSADTDNSSAGSPITAVAPEPASAALMIPVLGIIGIRVRKSRRNN